MLNHSTEAFLRFKQSLDEKKPVFGMSVTMPVTVVAEIVAGAGFDFCWIETEHTTMSLADMEKLIIALENKGCVPLVRVRENSANIIGQALDMGARIVNVPHVDTVSDAVNAVKAAKYYPAGRRGYASVTRSTDQGALRLDIDLMARLNRETMLMVQIESVEAVNNAEAIAAVEGIDALFVGYADLCQDMGIAPDPCHPRCAEAIMHVGEALRKSGIYGMFIVNDPADLGHYTALGFNMAVCGMDTRILRGGAVSLREAFGKSTAEL